VKEKVEIMNTVSIVEKRFGILVEARLRDRKRIESAISTQDRLREKSKGWSGAKEIRRWRDSKGL
jgi:hypothetical protein